MKRGRPTLPKALRKSQRITIRLNALEAAELARLTTLTGLSEANLIRHAVRAFHLPEETRS